jgi:hypothetical protein
MFRHFGALNARNLLYLQGDLARIEEELVKLEWSNSQNDTGKKAYNASSSKLLGTASVSRDGDVRQGDLVEVERMGDTLCRYSESFKWFRKVLLLIDGYRSSHHPPTHHPRNVNPRPRRRSKHAVLLRQRDHEPRQHAHRRGSRYLWHRACPKQSQS